MSDTTSVDIPRQGKTGRRPNFFKKFNAIVDRGVRELGNRDANVLMAFLRHGDEDDVSYPTPPFLGAKLGIHPRTIQRIIARLTRAGWLVTVHSGGGRNRSARRKVCIPDTTALVPEYPPETTALPRVVSEM